MRYAALCLAALLVLGCESEGSDAGDSDAGSDVVGADAGVAKCTEPDLERQALCEEACRQVGIELVTEIPDGCTFVSFSELHFTGGTWESVCAKVVEFNGTHLVFDPCLYFNPNGQFWGVATCPD